MKAGSASYFFIGSATTRSASKGVRSRSGSSRSSGRAKACQTSGLIGESWVRRCVRPTPNNQRSSSSRFSASAPATDTADLRHQPCVRLTQARFAFKGPDCERRDFKHGVSGAALPRLSVRTRHLCLTVEGDCLEVHLRPCYTVAQRQLRHRRFQPDAGSDCCCGRNRRRRGRAGFARAERLWRVPRFTIDAPDAQCWAAFRSARTWPR